MKRRNRFIGSKRHIERVLEKRPSSPDEVTASIKEAIDNSIETGESAKSEFISKVDNEGVATAVAYYADRMVRVSQELAIYVEIKSELAERPLKPVLEEHVAKLREMLLDNEDAPFSTDHFNNAVAVQLREARSRVYKRLEGYLKQIQEAYSGL